MIDEISLLSKEFNAHSLNFYTNEFFDSHNYALMDDTIKCKDCSSSFDHIQHTNKKGIFLMPEFDQSIMKRADSTDVDQSEPVFVITEREGSEKNNSIDYKSSACMNLDDFSVCELKLVNFYCTNYHLIISIDT